MRAGLPILSIITPVSNDTCRLRRTAASVASQTSCRFEWILVDNASTDGTADIIYEFAGHIDRLISEPDNGVYDAMNKGLNIARARFAQFLNAGDAFDDEEAVDRLCDALDRVPASVDIVLAGAHELYLNGRSIIRFPANIADTIHHRLPICHQAIIVRLARHMTVPFDPRYRIAADYAAIATMYRDGATCAAIHMPLVVFAIDHNSLSYRHPIRLILEYAKVQRQLLQVPLRQVLISGVSRMISIGVVYLMAVEVLQGLGLMMLARARAGSSLRRPRRGRRLWRFR